MTIPAATAERLLYTGAPGTRWRQSFTLTTDTAFGLFWDLTVQCTPFARQALVF